MFLVKFYVKVAQVQLFISKRRDTKKFESIHLILLWSQCFRCTFCPVTSFGLVPHQIRGVHRVPCEIIRKTSPGTALYLKNERHKNSRKLSIAFISFVLWSACFRSTFCLVTSFGLVPQQIRGVHLVPCEILRKSSPGTALYLKNERHKNSRKLSIAFISFCCGARVLGALSAR